MITMHRDTIIRSEEEVFELAREYFGIDGEESDITKPRPFFGPELTGRGEVN